MFKNSVYIAGISFLVALANPAFPESYKLQPGDRVQLTVVGVSGLEHSATVQQDGSLRLPLAGRLTASGKDIDDLTNSLAALLAEREGIRPDTVLLEIAEYRPIYVIGPSGGGGLVTYRPGLTVLQAAIQASGDGNNSELRLLEKLEAGRTRGAVERVTEQLASALLNRARLRAERDDNSLTLPQRPESLDETRWQSLTENTKALLAERRGSFEQHLMRLKALENVLRERVDALDNERELQEESISIVQEELNSLTRNDLRGLVTQERLNSVRFRLFDARLNRLRLLSDSAAAKSDVTMIMQELRQSQQQRNLGIATELERLETQIGTLALELIQARRDLSTVRSENGLSASGEASIFEAVFFIHRSREIGSETDVEAVSSGHLLVPGDVLEIRY